MEEIKIVVPEVEALQKPAREYSALDVAFAWICFVLGYLFCRVFPVVQSTLGGFLFVILLFGVTAFVLLKKGIKPGILPLIMAGVAIALSAALIISSNAFLYWLSYVFALCTYCYFVASACGNISRRLPARL